MPRQTATAASDIICQISNNRSKFEDISTTDRLEIAGNVNVMSLTFSNCRFFQPVHLKFLKLPHGLRFYNCEFLEGIALEHLTLAPNDTQAELIFNECKIGDITIHHITAASLNIVKSTVTIATVSNAIVRSISYTSGESQIIRFIEIQATNLLIGSASISDELNIHKSEIGNALVLKSTGNARFEIKELDTKGLGIFDSFLDHIDFIDISGEISIVRNEFAQSSNISGSKAPKATKVLREIEFKGNTFKKAFKVIGEDINLETITIDCNESLSGQLHFDNCDIKRLKITGTNSEGDLLFFHSEINFLEFQDFTNLKSLSFSGCEVWGNDAELVIVRSDMGKTKFLNHHFDYYQTILIEYSFLSEILTIACSWFTDDQLNVGDSENENARREVYRQLKHASEKQGDRIQALLFQAEELKAFEDNHEMVEG